MLPCLIGFAVFGIEAIGIEIENPFGHDLNDLPLDTICKNIQINIEELIASGTDNSNKTDELIQTDRTSNY
jgi:putative membrane protein